MFSGMKKKKNWTVKKEKQVTKKKLFPFLLIHTLAASLLTPGLSKQHWEWVLARLTNSLKTLYFLSTPCWTISCPTSFKKSISERQRNRKLSYTHLRNGQRSKGKDFLIANIDKRNASANLFAHGPCTFLPSWNPPQFFSFSENFLLWHWTFSVPLLPFWLVLCCLLLGVPKNWVIPLINGVPCDFIHSFIHLRNTYQKSVMY